MPSLHISRKRTNSNWTPTMPTTQTAPQLNSEAELASRAADILPQVETAKVLVGLEHHRQILNDYTARLRADDAAAGGLLNWPAAGEGEMGQGSIILCRDILGGDPQQILAALQGASSAPPRTIEPSGAGAT